MAPELKLINKCIFIAAQNYLYTDNITSVLRYIYENSLNPVHMIFGG